MTLKSIILATGDPDINQELSKELASFITTVDNGHFKKDIFDKLEQHKPHLLLLADSIALLEEDPERETFIREIRRQYPGTRIIYIYDSLNENTTSFIQFLINHQVFDFFNGAELEVELLIKSIQSGLSYKDVRNLIEGVQIDEVKEENQADPKAEKVIKPEKIYITRIEEKETEVFVTQKQKVILFYSPTSTGKSTLVQNTAVCLALHHRELEIPLIDFDFMQPMLATRMRLNQKNREGRLYFDELLSRIDGGRFDGSMLREFMLPHPKIPNLLVFNCEFRKPEYQERLASHHIEIILDTMKEEFGLILIDMNRDIQLVGSDVCFKKATAIYNIVDYDYSNCKEFQKIRTLFSQIPIIQKKPKQLIINKAIENPRFNNKLIMSFFEETEEIMDLLDPEPIASVPFLYEHQINAIYDGVSLYERDGKYVEEFKNAINLIANSIQPIGGKVIKRSYMDRFRRMFDRKPTVFKDKGLEIDI
ncbi:MAG: hypothetical protein JWM44_2112 [Bacilli bacterium]|nr:hypothetical protein [Bacilli bacterium]